jgi:predicted enzyme related to lactoylglutathione lyase
MVSRLTEIVVDAVDPARLAAFWAAVLGWRITDQDEQDVVVSDGGDGPVLLFQRVPGRKREKVRIHLDVNPVDRDQDAELERLLSLGARHADIGQEPGLRWHVLADPEGNEFCLLRTRVAPAPTASGASVTGA